MFKKMRKLFVTALIFGVLAGILITVKVTGASENKIIPEVPAYTADIDVGSNRYTRPEKTVTIANTLTLTGFTKIMEDSAIEVWHKEKNSSIRIVDKASGYIWGGLAEDKPKDMNTTWSGVGNSLVSIDYFDDKGIEKRTSIADKQVVKKYEVKDNSLTYQVQFKDIGIELAFQVILDNGDLKFKVDDASVKETGKYSLGAIYFVPFLGSTHEDEKDGYIFVPDGPGALIRLNKPSQYLINFNKVVYGKDYAIENLLEVNDLKSRRPNDFAADEPTVLMPVFGMVHGARQNAYFARIEKGQEYAAIMATPSGTFTAYNWVTAKFIYRQKYLQPTSKSGAGVQIVQKERNRVDAQISYSFLHGKEADYVGMAKLYRNMLKQEGSLPAGERIDEDIPLGVDVIASDIEKGYLFKGVLPITTPVQIRSMAQELKDNGINNITMVLKGWQSGGLNGSRPSDFSFEKKLGGKKTLLSLADTLESLGIRFYFSENPITVNETQFDMRTEGGNALSQALIKVERDNDTLWFKDTYFIDAGKAADYVTLKARDYSENKMNGMALEEFATKLYAENQKDRVITRSEVRKRFEEAARIASSNVEDLGLYTPNEYLWKYMNDAFRVPMVNSQYLFETDTVPFLQIVFKGSVDYYAPYSNESYYSRMDVLKQIEYGAYPSFLITALNNYQLGYTAVSELCSTNFDDWKEYMAGIYQEVNSALKQVEGLTIEDRTVLTTGVVKVTYQNGIAIIVNYTAENYFYNDTKVPAQNFAIVKGQ